MPKVDLPMSLRQRLDVVDFATPVRRIDSDVVDGQAVITIKSSIGLLHWRGFRVDLFFDALCENEELPAWKKCIEEAIDNSETQLNPLMLARQQIGLCHKKLHLRRHRSRSLGPQRKRCAQLVPLHAKTV